MYRCKVNIYCRYVNELHMFANPYIDWTKNGRASLRSLASNVFLRLLLEPHATLPRADPELLLAPVPGPPPRWRQRLALRTWVLNYSFKYGHTHTWPNQLAGIGLADANGALNFLPQIIHDSIRDTYISLWARYNRGSSSSAGLLPSLPWCTSPPPALCCGCQSCGGCSPGS